MSSETKYPLSEHIAEMRARLKVVFLALVIALLVVIFFPANPIEQAQHLDQYINLQFLNNTVVAAFLHQIVGYVLPQGWSLVAAKGIGEAMEIYIVASLILTLLLIMPVVAYETYMYIDPALREEERKLLYPFVVSTTLLFAVGTAFGYFALSKFLVLFLGPFFQATGTSYYVDASSFYFVIFLIIGATGVSFTAPAFVYALIKVRVLDPALFSRNRVLIWFGIWVVTGLVLTPDGGPLLDLIIFVPIVALTELAVWLGRRGLQKGVTGGPKPQDPACSFCNSPISPGKTFCPNCGRSTR